MITFDKVSKRYGPNHEALAEISFEIGAGEMVFVTGHSGAGKSTLLKLIGLVERPTRGRASGAAAFHACAGASAWCSRIIDC
jgi:cell division transport system ATP-binding protein